MCYISRYQTTSNFYNLQYYILLLSDTKQYGHQANSSGRNKRELTAAIPKKRGSTIEPTVLATSAPKYHVVSLQSHPLSLMRRTENKRTIGGWHDCDVVTCDQNQGVTPCQESWHDNGRGLYGFELMIALIKEYSPKTTLLPHQHKVDPKTSRTSQTL